MAQINEVLAVSSFGNSYIGRRHNNEDCLGKREPADPAIRIDRGCLYIVCDGMGGHSAGEVASQMAVETILRDYYARAERPQEDLIAAIQVANERIYAAAGETLELDGMGCTVVACVIVGDTIILAHVGDSRIYRFSGGKMELLTKDHLYLTEDRGISEEQARDHHMRHVLSRALGMNGVVQVETVTLPGTAGDRLLLCSDGISNALAEVDLIEALLQLSPRQSVTKLIEAAEEKQADDNSSAIVVYLQEVERSAKWDSVPTSEVQTQADEALFREVDPTPVGCDQPQSVTPEVAANPPADRPRTLRLVNWLRFRPGKDS